MCMRIPREENCVPKEMRFLLYIYLFFLHQMEQEMKRGHDRGSKDVHTYK